MNCNIGLFGLEFDSGNKGCSALAYTFIDHLLMISEDRKIHIHICVFSHNVPDYKIVNSAFIDVDFIKIKFKDKKFLIKAYKHIVRCDLFIDFTEGDSFSDIYGLKRIVLSNFLKQMVLCKHIPFVMGPQTYGPFKNPIIRRWSKLIIQRSTEVFTRDSFSAEYIYQITGRKIIESTDIAFKLHYEKNLRNSNDSKIKIGFNPSALLWSGGYTGDNQFTLTTDYKLYCFGVLDYFSNSSIYQVHLIPHVITEIYEDCENDMRICILLNEKYSNTLVAPPFKTPIEAKSYIAEMDLFIGARMHATIAAFSAGVATIPFSYSRKFEGLYTSLNYPFVISGKKLITEDSITQTIKWVECCDELKSCVLKSLDLIRDRLCIFYKYLDEIIFNNSCE